MTRLAATAAMLPALLSAAAASPRTGPRVERWGVTRAGVPVDRITFANREGMVVSAIGWGATLTSIAVPDRDGRIANVVLNLPDLAAYERSARRWAGVVGRYAGRIDRASFTLDGRRHRLEPGRNGVTLHGGGTGWDRRVWRAEPFADAASTGTVFRLDSPDGDQGFPGRVAASVTYRLLRGRSELRVEYAATTDRATVVNLTNHGFVNLAGAGSGTIAGHRVQLRADRYADVDARKIPTGRLLPVAGGPLDFRQPAMLERRIAASGGLDHSLVLTPAGGVRHAARIEDPASGRRLDILTTEPSLQINSGEGFDGSETGGEDVAYPRGAGLAIETQHLPDSPNRAAFPSTILRPGQVWRSTTVYRFSTFQR